MQEKKQKCFFTPRDFYWSTNPGQTAQAHLSLWVFWRSVCTQKFLNRQSVRQEKREFSIVDPALPQRLARADPVGGRAGRRLVDRRRRS